MSPEASFIATDAQFIIPESDPPFPTIAELTTTRRAPSSPLPGRRLPLDEPLCGLDPPRVSVHVSGVGRKTIT
jgi:hypothetical protein